MAGPVLVVGATGILGPAARALAARGEDVLAVARSIEPGPGAIATDATVPSFLDRLPERLAGALLYGPAVSAATVSGVAARARGPVVHVLTSSAADPESSLPSDPAGVRRLVLGWRADGSWHSPPEVSAAAVALFDAPAPLGTTVLGVVRPWTDRPR